MTIACICLSPGIQRSVSIDALALGEVNRLKSAVVDVSGKGINVCRVLQRLGIKACCLSQGGSNGEELLALVRSEGLDLRLTPSSGPLRTCTSIIETAMSNGCRVTELIEPSPVVEASCIEALQETLRAMLSSTRALVIAGSMAPGFPTEYQATLARLARAVHIPVFLDIQGAPLRAAIAAGATVVKINLSEFIATFLPEYVHGGEHSGALAEAVLAPEILAAIAQVSQNCATRFVLTRGANSILLAHAGDVRIVPMRPLSAAEILNPIGSGDAFLAGMLAALVASGALSEAPDLDALEKTMALATACAQSNARTLRPGFLEDGFISPPR